MITKRLAILQASLLLGLGSVFLLPKTVPFQSAAIESALPQSVGEWQGEEEPVTQSERDVLGPDTRFAKKLYTNSRGDQIYVSVVMSGPDMNTSIHRPERCLPAQGWAVADSKTVSLQTSQGPLQATRLHNMRNIRTESGRSVSIYSLNYYWFVGHSDVTASHLKRTWIDIRDRLLKGSNQQWAYVTVGGTITKDFKIFGRTEKEMDELIQNFIGELVPQLQKRPLASAE